ncbi:MAG TPA: hypothetical protein VGA13_10360 [Acidimicrobiales bacterium]|jgi:hypothetical protein
MYHFAIIALMALAILKLVDWLADVIPGADGLKTPLTFVAGIVSALVLDYSVFAGWGIAVDNTDFATVLTGFMFAGMTVPWRAAFSYLTHDKAVGEESLGVTNLHRAA